MSVDDAATTLPQADESPPPGADGRRSSVLAAMTSRPWILWYLIVPAGLALGVGGAFALLPDQVVYLSSWGAIEGLSDCAAEQGSLVVARCGEIGYPVGQVSFEAVLPRTIAYWLGLLPGVSSYAGYQITGLSFLAIGAAGCVALTRQFVDRWWPGGLCAVAFFTSAVVLAEPGLPQVFLGTFLLPAGVWAMLRLATLAWRPPLVLGAAAGGAAVGLAVLNTSGYSFLHLLTLVSVMGAALTFRQSRPWHRAAGMLGVVVLAAGVAGLLHKRFMWPQVAVGDGAPLEFFRGSSVDLVSLAVPGGTNHLWEFVGAPWGPWPMVAEGNIPFVGWVAALLAVVGIVALLRSSRWPAALGLAMAIATTGVLVLGPSLRVNDPWPPDGGEPGNFNARLMPAEAAAFDFPWAPAFTVTPLELARVVRRWAVPLHLSLDVAAAVGLAAVVGSATSRRRALRIGAAGVLVVAFLAESVDPELPVRLDRYDERLGWAESFRGEVLEPLDAALDDDVRVLFLPSANDYLATAVGPLADIRLLNVNGDKNVINVRDKRDPAIGPALRDYAQQRERWEETMVGLFDDDLVDALVLGDFSLRWASYQWPPTDGSIDDLRSRHDPAIPRFRELGCEAERFARGWIVSC